MSKQATKNPFMSLPGTTGLPSAGFPVQAILCITLCLSPIPLSVVFATAATLPFAAQPAFADALNVMKAREFLQKGNNHLNRYEFQQALDAYTECLLCDPNNRHARENIVLTHNNWGIWWFQKRKYKEAREEWDQALKLNPADRNARQNLQVLRVTLSRAGLSEDGEKKAPPAQPKASTDFPPSQAIILTPGIKQSSGSEGASGASIITGGAGSGATASSGGTEAGASSAASAAGSSGATGDAGSGAVVILKSSKTPPATTLGGDSSSSAISTYTNDSGVPSASSEGAGKFTTAPAVAPASSSPPAITPPSITPPSITPPSPTSVPSAATAGGSQGENIEDSIGQIEQKIYGRKQESLSIMKRLEKLETDTHGKTKSGTIKERIDTLRKSYGF